MKIALYILILILLLSYANANLSLEISEIFPNPIGDDKNEEEFIELHNYGNLSIGLSGIRLKNSKNKSIELSDFYSEIGPFEYLIFYPDFSLKNTDEKIMLFYGYDIIDEFNYATSIEDFSWVKINGEWYAGKRSLGMPNFKNIPEFKGECPIINKSVIRAETLLNINNESKGKEIYISKSSKQKKIGGYLFLLTLVFIVITLIVEKWKEKK